MRNLLILFVLFVLTACCFAQEKELRLHFYPPDSWEGPVRVHLWGGAIQTEWPGMAMERGSDGWWSLPVKGVSASHLIFNNDGRQQTADLERDREGWYRLGQWFDQKPAPQTESAQKLRLYYRPETHPDSPPNIYFWEVWPEGPSTSWPGEPMRREEDGWYVFELPVERANVIFNDGKGHQTANLFRNQTGFFQENHWFTTRPARDELFVDASPSIAWPNAYPFETSIKIQIQAARSAKQVSYRLDQGPWKQWEGQPLTLGEKLLPGQKIRLDLKAENDHKESFNASFLFEKAVSERHRHPFDQLRIYQVMVEAFRDGDPGRGFGTGYGPSPHLGDLKGVLQALDEIAALNVNAIWLTPVFESGSETPLAATGYFPTDYFAVDPHFGSFEDLKAVVDGAHARGLYVFFDGVFGHNGGNVKPSPKGRRPKGRELVDYTDPETLEFYKEVAAYWIDVLGIDGWRVDQAYQVPVEAWAHIREAVEQASAARQKRGESFGTLGFMVGEVWKGADEIRRDCFGGFELPRALPGCFDFPVRYRLVQTLAVQEHAEAPGAKGQPASLLAEALDAHRVYPPHAHPALMLDNHDLVRFGDLIERAGYLGPEDETYWARHRAAFSFLAAYTGPISIYYGDEYGAQVPDFINEGDKGWMDDHVSRDSGERKKTAKSEALRKYLADLMKLRSQKPALWSGSRKTLFADDSLLVEEKNEGSERIYYLLNTGLTERSYQITCKAALKDLMTGKVWPEQGGSVKVGIPALSGVFLE